MKKETLTKLPPEQLFSAIVQLLQEGYDAEFTVTGNSMWPLLAHQRDCVVLRQVPATSLKKGDIVLLAAEHGYLLHRITALKNGKLQTTGDHNCYRDDYVASDRVLGKVIRFTRKGRCVSCDALLYKVSAWCWRILFFARPLLLRLLFLFRRRTL